MSLTVLATMILAADVKTDLELFQGEWTAVALTIDGKDLSKTELAGVNLTVKDNQSTFTHGGLTLHGKYLLDPKKTPRALDIDVFDGPDKGKTKLSIYELKGDMLVIFHAPAGSKDRPTAFASKPGSGLTLEVWKRKK